MLYNTLNAQSANTRSQRNIVKDQRCPNRLHINCQPTLFSFPNYICGSPVKGYQVDDLSTKDTLLGDYRGFNIDLAGQSKYDQHKYERW